MYLVRTLQALSGRHYIKPKGRDRNTDSIEKFFALRIFIYKDVKLIFIYWRKILFCDGINQPVDKGDLIALVYLLSLSKVFAANSASTDKKNKEDIRYYGLTTGKKEKENLVL